MADEQNKDNAVAMPPRSLPAAAQRALAEAEARRAAAKGNDKENDPGSHSHDPKEINGPKGPEPTRYGDWEIKGIASDF